MYVPEWPRLRESLSRTGLETGSLTLAAMNYIFLKCMVSFGGSRYEGSPIIAIMLVRMLEVLSSAAITKILTVQ